MRIIRRQFYNIPIQHLKKVNVMDESSADKSPLREAYSGKRCLFCLSDSHSIKPIDPIPEQYRAEGVRERKIPLCESCGRLLSQIFDDDFFKNAAFLRENLEHINEIEVDDFPGEIRNVGDEIPIDYCMICGVRDPRIIERHHVYPRRHHPTRLQLAFEVINVCSNCHNRVERLYDDYFFNRIGINTGLVKIDEDDSETARNDRTIRPFVIEFVKKSCGHREGDSTPSNFLIKTFYNLLEGEEYEYNGSNTVILRIVDELLNYTTWEHQPIDDRRYSEAKYWNFGRFNDLIIPEDSWPSDHQSKPLSDN